MNGKLFLTVASIAGAALLGCGDDTGTGGSGATGGSAGGSGGTGATASTGAQGGGGASSTGGSGGGPDCAKACSDLYDCGLEQGAGGAGGGQEGQLCPGITGTPAEKMGYVESCIPACEDLPLLVNLVDPNNCPMTITTIKGANMTFKAFCENGSSQGGAGGQGGN